MTHKEISTYKAFKGYLKLPKLMQWISCGNDKFSWSDVVDKYNNVNTRKISFINEKNAKKGYVICELYWLLE